MSEEDVKPTEYAIYYKDGSYLIHEMSDDDAKTLYEAIQFSRKVVLISGLGVFTVEDIRSIIKQKPQAATDTEGAYPEITEEEYEYLKIQRTAWQEAMEGGDSE